MDFQSYNQTEAALNGKALVISAKPKSDFVVAPVTGDIADNGSFLYREVTGDFVFSARVSHDFLSTYDACALLAFESNTKWAKACFECTDLGTRAVVSVMTNGRSDDCNGVNLAENFVWLKLCRKDDIFSVHYSTDGKSYQMHRILYLPLAKTLKVGPAAQSPLGDGGSFRFEEISLTNRRVENIRKGE